MTEHIEIHSLEEKDVEECIRLLIDAFSKNYEGTPNSILEDSNAFAFTAKSKGEIVGYASLHLINKVSRKSGLIEDVAVHSEHRGKGIGKLLIETLIKTAKAQQCDKIILNSNERNIPFYEKIGFQKAEFQMIIRNQ